MCSARRSMTEDTKDTIRLWLAGAYAAVVLPLAVMAIIGGLLWLLGMA